MSDNNKVEFAKTNVDLYVAIAHLLTSRELNSCCYISSMIRHEIRKTIEDCQTKIGKDISTQPHVLNLIIQQARQKSIPDEILVPSKLWIEMQHRLLDWIGISVQEMYESISDNSDKTILGLFDAMRFSAKQKPILLEEWREHAPKLKLVEPKIEQTNKSNCLIC